MPTVKIKSGIKIYYEQHGEGDDVILIAGLSADHTVWASVLDALSARNRVLVFDNRGASQSDAPVGPYSCEMMAEDLISLMDHLSIPRATMIGHSMGGMILQQLCLSNPHRISHAIICASAAKIPFPTMLQMKTIVKYQEAQVEPELIFEATCPWKFGESFLRDQAKLVAAKSAFFDNPYPQSLEAFCAQVAACDGFDFRNSFNQISTKTVIVAGREDIITPVYCSEYLHQQIPNSRLEIIEDCGHMLQVEQPTAFTQLVRGAYQKQ